MKIPVNEPVKAYGPGSAEKATLKAKLKQMAAERIEIPLVIGGKEIRTGQTRKVVMPHNHRQVLAEFHLAGPKELKLAVENGLRAKKSWERLSPQDRMRIFEKAADLLAGSWRDVINGSTMLGQSKNVHQAEIDAACELIDFFRFNNYFYHQILENQPLSVPSTKNRVDYRPLEGFVFAITPFNFTSIAANLGCAPALVGNVAIWKPSDTQVLSAWYSYKLLEAAGLPPGVINFVPADGPMAGETLLGLPELGGIHFTGSTGTFRHIYKTIGERIASYRSYPRIVGETGGKDFVFVHPSADRKAVIANLVRGAFEYQGQKCSAASRAYIAESVWSEIKEPLLAEIKTVKQGDVQDFSNFVNAVIDERAFDKHKAYIDFARSAPDAKIIAGGGANKEVGYFIEPTVILTTNPKFKTMEEEIFGPVLTVYVYPDAKMEEALRLCESTSPYALTGAVFAEDRAEMDRLLLELRHAAGNIYINDKPTGAVVGQQPFGGDRASGTNDKAGSMWNLIRWISPRTIKEPVPPFRDYRYDYLKES